jgi:cytochrome c oxidase accessory protein FixG
MAETLYASHAKVYTKDVYGPVRSAKSAIMVACLAVYYTLPWLRWNRGPGVPDQAILLDLWHERFYFFNVVLWPQDIYLLTGALILAAIGLFLVTSLFGRVWCGYACPQTVWTDLFMTVERWIEGDRNARMKRDVGPWTRDKILRKAAKHWLWFWIAFWTGGAWIMYYVNAPVVVVEFWTGRASTDVYALTLLFTMTTYLLAGWAREQVCTYMCPWPRFQSAMLDEQSLIVTYEAWRGEPRGHGKRAAADAPHSGDCVDCSACVHVCPTGVDIRQGVQLGCINCGLCMDACNHVMDKMGTAPWLITWDTLARQKARAAGKPEKLHLLRARTMIYVGAFALCLGTLTYGLVTRPTTTLSAIHDRAPVYVRLRDGSIRNGYTLKLANKTQAPAAYTLRVQGLAGGMISAPEQSPAFSDQLALHVPAGSVGDVRVLVQGHPQMPAGGEQTLIFALFDQQTGKTSRHGALFLSPAAEGTP